MIYAVLILQFLFIISCTNHHHRSCSAKDQEILRRANLKIKSCFWYEYAFKNGQIDSSTRRLYGSYYYDKYGNEILQYNFNTKGDTIFVQKTKFNSENLPVEQTMTNLNNVVNIIKSKKAKSFFVYKDNKCIVEKMISDSYNDTCFIYHEYSKNKITSKVSSETKTFLTEQNLDIRGNIINESWYFTGKDYKDLVSYTKYNYKNKLLISEVDEKGKISIQYEYNSNGLLEKRILNNQSGLPKMHLYQYIR